MRLSLEIAKAREGVKAALDTWNDVDAVIRRIEQEAKRLPSYAKAKKAREEEA